jgi:hypothetical protein
MWSKDIDFAAIFPAVIAPITGTAVSSKELPLFMENTNWAKQTVAHRVNFKVSHEVSSTAKFSKGHA